MWSGTRTGMRQKTITAKRKTLERPLEILENYCSKQYNRTLLLHLDS